MYRYFRDTTLAETGGKGNPKTGNRSIFPAHPGIALRKWGTRDRSPENVDREVGAGDVFEGAQSSLTTIPDRPASGHHSSIGSQASN
jgi:hypothetical protein